MYTSAPKPCIARAPELVIANAEIHSNSQNYIIVILVVTPPCSKNTVVLARGAAFEMEAMSDILVYGGTGIICFLDYLGVSYEEKRIDHSSEFKSQLDQFVVGFITASTVTYSAFNCALICTCMSLPMHVFSFHSLVLLLRHLA